MNFNNDTKINATCRTCETWAQKDIIYAIGHVDTTSIKHLWLVYGDVYCANKSTYEGVATKITDGIQLIPNVELAETNELARANKVDPLGITYLRVRGMWGIEHPSKVFEYIYKKNPTSSFALTCIIPKNKYDSFADEDKNLLISSPTVKIEDKKIKNPDNPAKLIDVKLIIMELE